MRETATILLDTLHLLRARKLFWVVLGISLLVALCYASIGFHDEGWSIGFGLKSFEDPNLQKGSDIGEVFYLLLFTNFINPHWLGFLAVVLALMTSCSVFPEMMREGSIETVISKPVSRWKIFAVKYLGMLGFMAIPLAAFCLIVFLAMGLRVGVWKPEVFWAVPLLTFVFSILYSFAVFIGIWTRSTLFALLATVMLWGACFLVHISESFFYRLVILPANAGLQVDFETGETAETEAYTPPEGPVKMYHGLRRATWILPKPRKTTLLLERLIVFDDELGPLSGVSLTGILMGAPEQGLSREAQAKASERMSLTEILFPSALFQVVMLGVAGWIFYRRDF
jgi:ABC-type transport system involved in multi-copper enzyme maturation permease subunit